MLSHVTFTGWDRHTDLHELQTFLEDAPQRRVEIAVLFSTSRSLSDEDRYPDPKVAEEIPRTAKAAGQRTALHLCGPAARALITSAGSPVLTLPWSAGPLIHLADRVQINVGEKFWPDGDDRYKQALLVAEAIGRPVIVQSRSIGYWPDVEHLGPSASRMVPFLFDRSGGRGEAPIDWPFPRANLLVGYAGGLGPDNVAELCASIAGARIDGARWWLDMESRIRAPFAPVDHPTAELPTQTFVSVDKCRQVIRAVAPWLRPRPPASVKIG
jgi:hypothetical protein